MLLKKYSSSLVIRKTQIKPKWDIITTLLEWESLNISNRPSIDKDKELDQILLVGIYNGTINLKNHPGIP